MVQSDTATEPDLKLALKRGDIFLHAFPHDGEASYYPDASLFESALSIAEAIAEEVGFAAPVSVSQRDVPGWTSRGRVCH